ncbi:MAG: S23 ribosomal protein [Candidatus Saccharibacteria bacterium GW2011_GWA2_46_10]|nr:MAG: S23 ribosomal protein [Candidatus Saccharibacteria bacterium GW2011_GWA2_46_10]
MTIHSYHDLIVWQKATELAKETYLLVENFPKSELYALTAQIKRSAVSIPSNIAEGRRRNTRKDYCHFLTYAFGSGGELESQIELVKRLPFGEHLNFTKVDDLLNQVMRMLNKMIYQLQQKPEAKQLNS